MSVLAALWGASYMFIKVALDDVSPFVVVWVRLVLAALVLLPIAHHRGALREISSKQLIDARVLTRDLTKPAEHHVSLAAKPGSTLNYAFTIDGDTTRFADNASGQSPDMYAAALLVRELAKGPCQLPR